MAFRPVYSTQLFVSAACPPNQFVTCPTDSVMIVRDIDLCEQSGTVGSSIVIRNPAGGTFFGAKRATTGDIEVFPWRGRQVLVGGETIEIAPNSADWAVWISGYLLSAP